jgi:hypothetical protein
MIEPTDTRVRKIRAAILALILLFAAVVRVYGITRLSVWFDECATIDIVQTPWSSVLNKIKSTENTPPAYYLFLKCWCDFAGTSEWAIRLPSALMGVASVWLLYRLTSYCIGPNEGLIAAALMAASRYHIWYSQQARSYVLMILLALWSCDEFVRMLDALPKWQRELRYWIANVLLLYAHLYGVFAIVAQGVYYLFRKAFGPKPKLPPAKFAQLLLAIGICFAMWLPVLKHWYQTRAEGFWIEQVGMLQVARSYLLYSCNQSEIVLFVICALVAFGAFRRDLRSRLPLILSLLLLPVLVPVEVSMLTHPLYDPRYGMIAMIGVLMLAAGGIALLPTPMVPVVTILLAILTFVAPNPTDKDEALSRMGTGTIGPFRQVGAYLRQWVQPGDDVWVNPRADLAPVRYYLANDSARCRGFWGKIIPIGVPLPHPRDRLWLVLTNPAPKESGAETINYGHWRVVSQKKFDYVTVFELADGATSADNAYPDDIRFDAKPPTKDRTPPAR